MQKPKYNIGDTAWAFYYDNVKDYETCPDCRGDKYVTLTLGCGNKFTLECETCTPGGYESATGRIAFFKRRAEDFKVTITSVDVSGGKLEYKYERGGNFAYYAKESELASTKEKAIALGEEAAREANEKERYDFYTRERPDKKWSWNVSYYRGQIKKATKDLEYYGKMLDAQKEFAKKEREEAKKLKEASEDTKV